jgi:hypothetical protein
MAPSGRSCARPFAEPVARDHDLIDDLGGGEIAHEPLGAGVAEGAVERAADLARDAERAAVALRDIDALDLMRALARRVRRQADEPFARAVGRNLLGDDLGPPSVKCSASFARSAFETLLMAAKSRVPRK